jgi:hypothetical protein
VLVSLWVGARLSKRIYEWLYLCFQGVVSAEELDRYLRDLKRPRQRKPSRFGPDSSEHPVPSTIAPQVERGSSSPEAQAGSSCWGSSETGNSAKWVLARVGARPFAQEAPQGVDQLAAVPHAAIGAELRIESELDNQSDEGFPHLS